jgi:penicillin-binding protein 2
MFSITPQRAASPEIRQRTHLITTVGSIVFLLLVGRLFFLQVLQGEHFTYLSKNNSIRLKKTLGLRGMVFDRRGRLLVDNRPAFDLVFVHEDTEDPEATLRHLTRILDRNEGEFLDLHHQNERSSSYEEIVLERDIDWRSVVAVETHQFDLPGVELRISPRRNYPQNGTAAHLLGYVGEISPEQLKDLKEKGYGLGDEIGQSGMEKKWEKFLRSRRGGQQVEVDALGRPVRILLERQPVPGKSAFLTLDRDLQETAYRALKGKEGAIVVMEVRSGAILALVSTPAFNPNAFANGMTRKEWRVLAQDEMNPLNNKATRGKYPPGSTFKIVVAIAALEEDLIQPETRIFDPGYFAVGNRKFRGWKKGGHGWVDLHKAIVQSSDVYFYGLGQQLGIDRIARYARMLGLGKKTGIALDGEKEGLIPDSVWKKNRIGQPWFPGDTPSAAIGQGYVSVTPLQMANLMTTIANGGTLYRPWFVRKVESADGTLIQEYGPQKIRTVPMKDSTLVHIRRALRDVVNSRSGTGGKARSGMVGIAGKTGTAQVVAMRNGSVKSEELPYVIRDHAWFVAYAPVEQPEIALAVLVEHGGHGGSAAAPLAKTLIEKYFSLPGAPYSNGEHASGEGKDQASG